ncbi:MBL fold metallo-hydrolase [Dehalococcoides mccartyi]|nr:MBL fold metallo-hydrolase [Dehalococcoides mccartyi]
MPITGTSKSDSKSKIVFLGTGTSEGVPRVSCLTNPDSKCPVCPDAMNPGSPNRRRNTSLLIQREMADGRISNVVIDAGKFFYESAMNWFPKFGVQTIDGLVITHAHADAVGGFDDLRDWTNNAQSTLPIYLRETDLDSVESLFYYLVDRSKQTGGGGVAKLNFQTIDENPFDVDGLEFIPLPVEHGRNYEIFGYRFGPISYVSDASGISDETARLIEGSELLILDALRPVRTHGTHFTVEEAVEQVRRLGAPRTLLVDATHDIDHHPVNAELAKLKASDGLDIQYAHDGLAVDIEL